MPPKRNTKGKKAAAAGKKEGTTGDVVVPAATKVKNLKAKIYIMDEQMVLKKNRLKIIDAYELDKDEFEAEKANYEEELAELDEDDPKFDEKSTRIERHLARSTTKHNKRLEQLFADLAIDHDEESTSSDHSDLLEEEKVQLNQEVENLRLLRKKWVKQLEDAEKELRGDSSETQSSESSD